MPFRKLLIANRGEVAVRIARAAAELGIPSVAVFSEDDAGSGHVRSADEAWPLSGSGGAAYLDGEGILAAARAAGCDALHPGYGFLSENADFARRCAERGVVFVGPPPELLALFGDKLAARALARRLGIPLLPGTEGPTSLDEAAEFFAALGAGGAMMIKAVAGGGGRGLRVVRAAGEVADAWARAQSEAKAAFGVGDVYVERLLPRARHLEVQIVGDGARVVHLYERECTLQRRHQKLVEVAPSPDLAPALRERLLEASLRMAQAAGYRSLGTFEFLVDADGAGDAARHVFLEVNPRLQVEHTVTEEVTGVDLVQLQIRLAAGATLAELGLDANAPPAPRGIALEARVLLETPTRSGDARPSAGTLAVFEPPSGPGVRVDTFASAGYATSARFDPLLAKLIVRASSGRFADAAARAVRALGEFRIEGVATNVAFLRRLLAHPDVVAQRATTRFVEEHLAELVPEQEDAADEAGAAARAASAAAPPGTHAIGAPLQGKLVSVDVAEGALVRPGQQVAVLEAMKMEHVVTAARGGRVRRVAAQPGEVLAEGQPILFVEPAETAGADLAAEAALDLDALRADLAEVIARHRAGQDAARPDAVERRRRRGQRTARENVEDLVDAGSFIEYGALVLAAQRRRRTPEELLRMSPADGLVTGIASVNGALFDETRARCMVMAYDFTVFAGTQGAMNHKKKDRMIALAEAWRLPIVLFAEGGGGRPGDTEGMGVAGLDTPSFVKFGRLSGLVPLIGVVSGRCFAGNAALLGCCDVIIATEGSNIGMGGPAMIEGGGLGVYAPEEVGPLPVQRRNGVVDVAVRDETEAVDAARRYLSYFQGTLARWEAADPRLLRTLVPENRLRAYDVRRVIETIADTGSVLELRRDFGVGILTALVRVEGRPLGLIANNPLHLGGAIDPDAADKASRFLQLCDAFDLPVLSLCDTPGFMVGPPVEEAAQVRHACRMFVTAASLRVPVFTIVLRKGYGLGAQAMAAGSFHAPFFIASWPTGEFGGMGLEGAVRLGFRRELEAVADPAEREAMFQRMVAAMYERGKAIHMAEFLEIDAVIDPAETRTWLMRGLRSLPPREAPSGKRRPFVDAW